MMCKECMNKNKQIYYLDKRTNVLININGRVCCNDFEDNIYHCLGKFESNKEIKDCIPEEFICKACQELNRIKDYYYY